MKNREKPIAYAVKNRDEKIRMASRSGGMFTALSDECLQHNGVVYGAVLTQDFTAVHMRAESAEDRDRMRGSKYIQSSLGDTYKQVENDLKEGRQVLFSGTSCQIAGVKKFLNHCYDNLTCVDIVCHGVPSPKVWKSYLLWQEKRHHRKVKSADFRDKREFGWHDHVETLKMEDGRVVHSKVFTNIFYGHHVLRPCCYECPFKSIMHPGDITLADFWGIEKAFPEFDDNKGVSLVLINNDHGLQVFEKVRDRIIYKASQIEDAMQPPLIKPFEKPYHRERFWDDFAHCSFDKIARKYGQYGLKAKVIRGFKRIMRKIWHVLKIQRSKKI